MKMNPFLILIIVVFVSCISSQSDLSYETIEEPAEYQRETNVNVSKKYGYLSECLVLMEGPVPSRMEPCIVGDVRSATEMYKEGEVTVKGDRSQFEWQISGMVYSPFVNEVYYQNYILYRGSFFRKSEEDYYRRTENHSIYPYLSRPSYRYQRGGHSR